MDETLVSKAVAALQTYHCTMQKKSKPKLIDEDPLVSMVVALKKIPDRTVRPLRVPLPHTLYPIADTDLCLITKREKEEAKEFLKEKKVEGISKVIPISKLKTNYKSFEAKRQLCSNYDIFLSDKRVYQMLPRLLGKRFFEKKKLPIPVDMLKKDLAQEIQGARNSTYLHIGLGSCCNVSIGRVGFTCEQLVTNALAAIKGVSSHIPRGLHNIQSVHLKTPDSISLPIYNSLPPPPALLPAASDEGPPTKRVKLDSDTDNDSKTETKKTETKEVNRKRKMKPSDLPLERCLEFSDVDNSNKTNEKVGKEETVPKKKRKISKLSVKKVRGSTVQSSKYEKAIKRKTKI